MISIRKYIMLMFVDTNMCLYAAFYFERLSEKINGHVKAHINTTFDAAKRGLALAGVGRSAGASASPNASLDFAETIGRDNYLRSLREHWTSMRPSFANSSIELSSSDVDRLWSAVTFILTNRAARHVGCSRGRRGMPGPARRRARLPVLRRRRHHPHGRNI